MKKLTWLVGIVLVLVSVNLNAAIKTYQVTGPVLESSDSRIVVQKGDDKWEIVRDANTNIKGEDLKVGAKVTIEYSMIAKTIEVKADKGK